MLNRRGDHVCVCKHGRIGCSGGEDSADETSEPSISRLDEKACFAGETRIDHLIVAASPIELGEHDGRHEDVTTKANCCTQRGSNLSLSRAVRSRQGGHGFRVEYDARSHSRSLV